MFTGIIEETGKIAGRKSSAGNVTLTVEASKVMEDLKEGDSISVNGACLTVEKIFDGGLSPRFLLRPSQKPTLEESAAGATVNLERSLKYGERVGGHFLQGHVDFRSTLISVDFKMKTGTMKVYMPPEYRRYIYPKCSIGIDGISLTVAEINSDSVTIWIIPYTLKNTNLLAKKAGSEVNVEIDMLAKNVAASHPAGRSERIRKEAYL